MKRLCLYIDDDILSEKFSHHDFTQSEANGVIDAAKLIASHINDEDISKIANLIYFKINKEK